MRKNWGSRRKVDFENELESSEVKEPPLTVEHYKHPFMTPSLEQFSDSLEAGGEDEQLKDLLLGGKYDLDILKESLSNV